MINKVVRYYHTLKHLSSKQLFWLVINTTKLRKFHSIIFVNFEKRHQSFSKLIFNKKYNHKELSYKSVNEFSFLNRTVQFENIEWDYKKNGMLWVYNLNYFDFLLQDNLEKEEGKKLIHDFINSKSRIGYEPYPLSLRIINWIKFICINEIEDKTILDSLYYQIILLSNNIEYHLQGNHLFENGFALLWGAYFFKDEKIQKQAEILIQKQLNKQILKDGGHYELSPMYHQIILYRLLEIIDLISNNNIFNNSLLNKELLKNKASDMRSWLENITYLSGNIPMVNDATSNISISTQDILAYSKSLGISSPLKNLGESGYRIIRNKKYEALIDIGSIKSNEQPGHTHSDIFNFELIVRNEPIIVDTGTSTYEKNERRQIERSIISHNTVQIENIEPIEIWQGFRVGRRAKVIIFEDSESIISAKHNGYKKLGIEHKREFKFSPDVILITDEIIGSDNQTAKAHFHFSNKIEIEIVNESCINTEHIKIEFDNCISISKSVYKQALGFNKLIESVKITVLFKEYLITKIHLN